MGDDKDPFETFSSETLRRAEEMCSSLSSSLDLDRRGQTTYYDGALSDMDDASGRSRRVTVAEVNREHVVTVIADQPLDACKRALLVYREAPGRDRRYLGRHKATRPGNRYDDDDQHITEFEIVEDVRRK